MERSDTYEMHHDEVGTMVDCTPSALYLCGECASEYKWVKGKPLETIYDSHKGEYGFERRF
jgi:hypothetical protein